MVSDKFYIILDQQSEKRIKKGTSRKNVYSVKSYILANALRIEYEMGKEWAWAPSSDIAHSE